MLVRVGLDLVSCCSLAHGLLEQLGLPIHIAYRKGLERDRDESCIIHANDRTKDLMSMSVLGSGGKLGARSRTNRVRKLPDRI